jgi:hypothetical protein
MVRRGVRCIGDYLAAGGRVFEIVVAAVDYSTSVRLCQSPTLPWLSVFEQLIRLRHLRRWRGGTTATDTLEAARIVLIEVWVLWQRWIFKCRKWDVRTKR